MPGPLSYRKFAKELKEAGATLDESGAPHIVRVLYGDNQIGTFSVSHSGRKKGNEVKFPYVSAMRKALIKAQESENVSNEDEKLTNEQSGYTSDGSHSI